MTLELYLGSKSSPEVGNGKRKTHVVKGESSETREFSHSRHSRGSSNDTPNLLYLTKPYSLGPFFFFFFLIDASGYRSQTIRRTEVFMVNDDSLFVPLVLYKFS